MKIILANGCWDLFHYGHLLHLEAARKMGEVLIVSVTDDAHVNKEGRPIFPAFQRAAIVGSLKCVTQAIIVTGLVDAFEKVKPDIVVKGRDYGSLLPAHEAYCKARGIEIRFTDTPKFSSTDSINESRRRSGL